MGRRMGFGRPAFKMAASFEFPVVGGTYSRPLIERRLSHPTGFKSMTPLSRA